MYRMMSRCRAKLEPVLQELRGEIDAAWDRGRQEYRRLAGLERRERWQDIKAGLRRFCRETFVDSPRLVWSRGIDRRRALFMAVAVLTPVAGLMFILAPGAIFPSPSYNAYYHFASVLRQDPASLWPVFLGAIAWVLALRFPLAH